LVGRDDEIRTLRGVVDRLERGRTTVAAAVVGEAGMGKTALLAEALSDHVTGQRVKLVGFEPEQQVPFAAASPLLHKIRRIHGEEEEAVALLRSENDGATSLEPLRLFEAVHRSLARIAPVVITLDDVQWADEMSIALMNYVLRAAQADDDPLGLIFAGRPSARTWSFVDALRTIFPNTSEYPEISLGPLEMDAAIDLARSIDPAVAAEQARHLVHEAAGSPFWIRALVRERSHPEERAASITERLRISTGDASGCLAVMVVIGRPVMMSELVSILGWEGARVEHGVSELINRGVVRAVGVSVQITHDLIRERARDQLPERELVRLHRQIADVLEKAAGTDLQLLVESLEHRCTARSDSVELALKIATSPQRRLLGNEALTQVGAIADAGEPSFPATLALQREVAALIGELGDSDAALARWRALSDRLGSEGERAQAAVEAARYAIDVEDSPEARRLLDRARSEGSQDPWIKVESDALEHALLAWVDHDIDGARRAMQRAVAGARRLVDGPDALDALSLPRRRAYVEALRAERDVALMDEDIDRLVMVSDERAAATRGLGEAHLAAVVDAATTLWYLDRPREAAARLQRVLEEARRQVFPGLTAEICHALALTRYHLGDLDEAAALLEEATRLETRLPIRTRRKVPWVRGGLEHVIAASRGSWRDAMRALHDEIAKEPDPHSRVRLHLWRAIGLARFGGASVRDEVVSQLESGVSDVTVVGCRRCRAELELLSVELRARVGDVKAASAILGRWDQEHPEPQPRARFQRLYGLGLLAAAVGRVDAPRLLRNVASSARATGARLEETWCLVDLGSALVAADRAGAIVAWETALQVADDIGASSEAALIRRHLRSVGARAPLRRVDAAGGTRPRPLSERELEVARLAASGARNADIAEQLFLSRKTVERHLSNVFAKLNVRNRAELVARLVSELPEEAERAKG